MAIRSKADLFTQIKERLADDTSDDMLSLIEDIDDTLNDYDSRLSDSTDWKSKYEENDRTWRQKYRDRFFSSQPDDDEDEDEEQKKKEKKKLTFEDLFTVKEN